LWGVAIQALARGNPGINTWQSRLLLLFGILTLIQAFFWIATCKKQLLTMTPEKLPKSLFKFDNLGDVL
jgi:hypothetical protein